jgi:hypothetical protein
MDQSDKKPQLSSSMLNMAAACGIQFQRVAAAVGTAVHKGVQKNLTAKLNKQLEVPLEDIKDTVRDALSGQFCEGVMLQTEEALDIEKTRGAAVDKAIALSALHYTAVAPAIHPAAIEEPFTIEMVNYPIDLGGKIDIIENGNTFRDTKTSGKTPAEDAARSLQVGVYSLSRQVANNGVLPVKATLDYLVATKVPKYEPRSIAPDKALIDYTLARYERLVTIIELVREGKQALQPATPDDWRCSAAWCGFAKSCKFYSGR